MLARRTRKSASLDTRRKEDTTDLQRSRGKAVAERGRVDPVALTKLEAEVMEVEVAASSDTT